MEIQMKFGFYKIKKAKDILCNVRNDLFKRFEQTILKFVISS